MGFFINASKNKKRQKAIFLVTAILVTAGLVGSSLIGVFSGSAEDNPASQLPLTPEQTIAELEEQLKENPEDVSALNRLAEAYYDNDQVDKSLETYKKALQIDPANSSVRTSLAITCFLADKHDQAVTEMKTELEQNPGNKKAHYYLGQFLAYGKGSYTEGIKELQTFIDTAASDELFKTEVTKAKQMVEDLKNLEN